MNFTREPIIETIVSPKDGYKLCIRNSKVSGSEEFFVDAVEVVSFGPSFFFRGLERPKPFLVPVSDYEVFEVKETRVVLKTITHDRNIKIGGGREASLKSSKETLVEKKEEVKELDLVTSADVAAGDVATGDVAADLKTDKKRDRRRSRRRRIAEEKKEDGDKGDLQESLESQVPHGSEKILESRVKESVKLEVPVFSQMLPPPTILISERLSQLRAKEMAEGLLSEGALTKEGSSVELIKAVEEEVSVAKSSEVKVGLSTEEFPKITSEEIVDPNEEETLTEEHAKVNTEEEENFNF